MFEGEVVGLSRVRHGRRAVAALAVVATLVGFGLAVAPTGALIVKSTEVISVTPAGAAANGVASEPLVSQDKRTARFIAYVSTSTNLVDANTGGVRNVYVARRAAPYGDNGTPWELGDTILASRGKDPPNGDSYGAQIDGDDTKGSHCLAFVSEASNLVPGDTDGRADAFVRNLPDGGLRRFQAPQPITEVDVDRGCAHLFYVTGDGLFKVSLGSGALKAASRVVGGPGIQHFAVADDAKSFTFARGGHVFYIHGRRRTDLGAGGEPSISGTGKFVAFTRDGTIYKSNLGRSAHAIGQGSSPQVTLAGHDVLFVSGTEVRAETRGKPVATCPSGASSPSTSGHSNYVAFVCDSKIVLVYVGPQ